MVLRILKVAILSWPFASPFLRSCCRNAHFRLQLQKKGNALARIVYGDAFATRNGICVDDGEVSVSMPVPPNPVMEDLLEPAPACALVIGSRVIDVMLMKETQLVGDCPFISLSTFARISQQVVQYSSLTK